MDATAGTWLEAETSPAAGEGNVATSVNQELSATGVRLRLLVCGYDGSSLDWTRSFRQGELAVGTNRWSCQIKVLPLDGRSDALDIVAAFRLVSGNGQQAGVAVAFDFGEWSTNNYLLIPASVYNANRNRIVDRGYNAGLEPADHYKKDLQLTTADLPHLSIEPGRPSKLEVLACNASTPAICVFERKAKRGLIILAEQAGRNAHGNFIRNADGEILDNGFSVEENADRSRATLVVSAPGVRERKPEFIGFSASPDRGLKLQTGDSVILHLRVFTFATPDVPGLLDKFMTVRKDLTGPNQPRNLIPFSEVTRLMTRRIDSRFYQGPDSGFYCPENATWIAFGWIGGWIDTYPMLALGDEFHLQRVSQTLDYGLSAQEPSGYFHYAIDEKGNDTFRDPGPDMNLARTSGDILFWMIKHFQLLDAQGRHADIHSKWEEAMKKLADAMVVTWQTDGQWGKLINVKTGEVAEYNTTGGSTIIGGLALASEYFHEPKYLRVAQEAADFYYRRDFVQSGMTTGGCADIFQNADSESAAGFMTSLMTLYEVTGDRKWLEKSRNLANLVATWTVSYDYELPTNTDLARLGAKLAGVVWASTQNKHGAPGICCSSGDALFKLYRATGDRRYADLIRDIVHAHAEGIRPDGRITERLTYCDADSRGSRGSGSTGWNESNGALMALELPGIYVRTDKDELYVFDSVQAQVVRRDETGLRLAISNPTKFDAKVSIFAEDAHQAAMPCSRAAFLKWPEIEVKAGAVAAVLVSSDGVTTVRP
jgi:hypothetical protein